MDAAPTTPDEMNPHAAFVAMPGTSFIEPYRITPKPAANDLAGWVALLTNSGVQADRIASPDLVAQLAQLEGKKIDRHGHLLGAGYRSKRAI